MTLSRLATSALYEKYTPAGIAGYGGWASVTATTGSVTTGTYSDGSVQWQYWKFTSSGSVTVTAGVVDALLVGGGGGAGPNGTSSGGRINYGLLPLTSGTHTVTVGAGGAAANYASGRWSGLGPHIVGDIKGLNGSGSGEVNGGDSTNFGIASSITGSSVNYGIKDAAGNLAANTGSTCVNVNVAGSSGVVIIRVPVNPDLWGAPPAQGVLPNLNVGWASVTAATGTFTKSSYTDADGQWTYWKWTGAGSVTTTAGVVDCLMFGGGGGASTASGLTGMPGYSVVGVRELSASTHTVTIGSGGQGGQATNSGLATGGSSSLGSVEAFGGHMSGNNTGPTTVSAITGTNVTYGGYPYPTVQNVGAGSSSPSAQQSGGSGVVIIRVPTAFDLT